MYGAGRRSPPGHNLLGVTPWSQTWEKEVGTLEGQLGYCYTGGRWGCVG
jgi:hypothetical protein